MANRDGLLVDLKISQATGTAEREAAEEMIKCSQNMMGLSKPA